MPNSVRATTSTTKPNLKAKLKPKERQGKNLSRGQIFSHDSISSIKMLKSHHSKSNNNGMQNYDQVKLNIAALKGRLRILFKNFIKLKN
jgi:hypothetical protein